MEPSGNLTLSWPSDALRHVQASLELNGASVTWEGEARRSLLDAIRGDFGLTGSHGGCEGGECGSCTVLFDGSAARSCLLLAVQASGHSIVTIEGVSPEDGLHAVQRALGRHHGLQCGYCTPGMVISIIDLMESGQLRAAAEQVSDDSELDSIARLLSGQLCRCTGYAGVVAALNDLLVSSHDSRPCESAPGDD